MGSRIGMMPRWFSLAVDYVSVRTCFRSEKYEASLLGLGKYESECGDVARQIAA